MSEINQPGKYLLCISGATSGSNALLLELVDKPKIAIVRGSGLMPLEMSPTTLFREVRGLCDSVHAAFTKKYNIEISSPIVTCALSSLKTQTGYEILFSAADGSTIGPVGAKHMQWITRGEACMRASRLQSDAIVIKVGTVAFAHAFLWPLGQKNGDYRGGGWGLGSGADGGAYYIGCAFMHRLFEELDGRAERTAFIQHMADLMSQAVNQEALARWLRDRYHTFRVRPELSDLARIAIHLAEGEQKDGVSRNLLINAAHSIAHSCVAARDKVQDHHRKFGRKGLTLVLHGEPIQNSRFFCEEILDKVIRMLAPKSLENIRVQTLRVKPVLGCVAHALEERYKLSHSAISRFLESLVAACPENLVFSKYSEKVLSMLIKRGYNVG